MVRQAAGYLHARRTHSREFNTRHRSPLAHACGVNTSRTLHSTPVRSTTMCGYSSSAAPPFAGKMWPSISTLQDTRLPTAVLVKDLAFTQPEGPRCFPCSTHGMFVPRRTRDTDWIETRCPVTASATGQAVSSVAHTRMASALPTSNSSSVPSSSLRCRRACCRSASHRRPWHGLREWNA